MPGEFKKGKDSLTYRFDAEKLVIMGYGKNSLRVRSTLLPEMPPEDWALQKPCTASDCEISITDGIASIRNGKIEAKITKFGQISYYNQDGKLLLNEYSRNRRDLQARTCSALEIEARTFRPIIGGDYELYARFETVSPDEKIYGMGQYQQPYLNIKGCDLELAHRNSQASVPFMLSSLGYGFLWNNPAVGRVTFGKNVTTWEARSTKNLIIGLPQVTPPLK
jgi:alpha-D-xyloside xylohydrolase